MLPIFKDSSPEAPCDWAQSAFVAPQGDATGPPAEYQPQGEPQALFVPFRAELEMERHTCLIRGKAHLGKAGLERHQRVGLRHKSLLGCPVPGLIQAQAATHHIGGT